MPSKLTLTLEEAFSEVAKAREAFVAILLKRSLDFVNANGELITLTYKDASEDMMDFYGVAPLNGDDTYYALVFVCRYGFPEKVACQDAATGECNMMDIHEYSKHAHFGLNDIKGDTVLVVEKAGKEDVHPVMRNFFRTEIWTPRAFRCWQKMKQNQSKLIKEACEKIVADTLKPC